MRSLDSEESGEGGVWIGRHPENKECEELDQL